jgi:hypothetical protein
VKYSLCFVAITSWIAIGCDTGAASGEVDPIGFTFESAEGSLASFGWTGNVHAVIQPAGTPFGVKVTECRDGICRFEGPVDPRGDVQRRRCLLHMSQVCESDGDCTSGGTPSPCVYIYDTPIATPLIGRTGVGACAWSYIPIAAADQPPTIVGTLNLLSGALHLERLTVLLPLNAGDEEGTFLGACAECDGDTTPNDGIRGGTCKRAEHLGSPVGSLSVLTDDGPDIGKPCDRNRRGTINGYDGDYSMDCAPTVRPTGGQPLLLGGSFTSSGIQLPLGDDSPTCTTGGKCFCGMCPDNKTACASKADCGGLACTTPTQVACDPNPPAGDPNHSANFRDFQCRRDPAKFAVVNNACPSGMCDWDADKGAGTCTDNEDVKCYPSGANANIAIPGRAVRDDHVGVIFQADTSSARCIPAGNSVATNIQLGLPGLLFQKRNFNIIPYSAEDTK